MKERTYSMSIANEINDFLTEDDWHFSFDDQRGMFKFGLSLKGKLKKVNYVIDVKDDEYVVYAISPLGADEDDPKMMANMAEFVCRANYGLKMGNFELDFDDGEIRFKVHMCCEDITPTKAMIKRSIYCPATMFDRYGSGILDVIFNDVSGKDAVEKCEQDSEDQLRGLLSRLASAHSGDESDDGMSAMLARLASRLGVSNDDDDDTSLLEEPEDDFVEDAEDADE